MDTDTPACKQAGYGHVFSKERRMTGHGEEGNGESDRRKNR